MTYTVQVAQRAAKALRRMDRATRERIQDRLLQLAKDPFDGRVSKRLKGMVGMRSSRVGDWRILYTVVVDKVVVLVTAVRPRGSAYR